MKQFYLFYSGDKSLQQVAAKIDDAVFSITWGHQMYILDKIKDLREAITNNCYLVATIGFLIYSIGSDSL